MSKFYLSKRAARVTLEGRTFDFDPADYFEPSHSWWCTYATDDPAEIAVLSIGVSRGLISELTEAEYADYEVKKKSTPFLGNIVHLKNKHAPSISMATGKPAVVVEGTAQPSNAPAETIDDVLDVKPVARSASRRK